MKFKILCVLLSLILLCGCERDNRIDIISFCKAFNEFSQSQIIIDDNLIKEPNTGDYVIYIGNGNARILLRVGCDKGNAVTELTVTGKEKNAVILVSEYGIKSVGTEIPERLDTNSQKENETISWFESDGYYTFQWEKVN